MNIVSMITLMVEKISPNETTRENNNLVCVKGVIFQPKISFGEYTPMDAATEKKVIKAIISPESLEKDEADDFEPQLNQMVYTPALRTSDDIYIRYDGLPQNLVGMIRVTSYGEVGTDCMSRGQPVEFKNKVEKFDGESWKEI